MKRWLLVLSACCAAPPAKRASPTASIPTLAITGVTIVHPALDGSAATEADRTVVIRGERIVQVSGDPPPPGARVIDGRGKWLIPGLIDSHVHFFQSANPFTRPDAMDYTATVPYAQEVARNKQRLPTTFRVWLASGVTSVVDTGGPMWNFEVRDKARHSDAAPRVLIAGPLVSMVSDPPLDLDDPPIIECKTPDDARRVVAAQVAKQPDFIKVWFVHRPPGDLVKETAVVRAAADAAHAAHLRLLVHATELDVAKLALQAGADILVHSVMDQPVDADFIALALEHHAILIPTLWVAPGYPTVLSGAFEPTEAEARLGDPAILAEMKHVPKPIPKRVAPPEPHATELGNLLALWQAGVPIAMGTDAGNIGTLHGPGVFREMTWMAEAGLTPLEVLRTATVNGAKVLGLEAELGDVAAGKLADLVLLDADPLASVDNLARASLVVRAGRTFVPAEIMASLRR